MSAILSAIVAAFLKFLSGLILDRQAQKDATASAKEAGASEAGNETQDVIAGIADDRSKLSPLPSDAHALAERLRADAAAARANRAGS